MNKSIEQVLSEIKMNRSKIPVEVFCDPVKYIPLGRYCHTPDAESHCPFFEEGYFNYPDGYPGYLGYCHYLDEYSPNEEYENNLWDMCKECGLKYYYIPEFTEYLKTSASCITGFSNKELQNIFDSTIKQCLIEGEMAYNKETFIKQVIELINKDHPAARYCIKVIESIIDYISLEMDIKFN